MSFISFFSVLSCLLPLQCPTTPQTDMEEGRLRSTVLCSPPTDITGERGGGEGEERIKKGEKGGIRKWMGRGHKRMTKKEAAKE